MKHGCSILFVCAGNTCRSPMAEAIAKAELVRSGIEGVSVRSAGLDAAASARTSRNAVVASAALGDRLTPRAARPLTLRRVARADLILAMTDSQKRRIAETWPGAREKTHTVSEFSGSRRGGVADPVGGDENVYLECALALRSEIRKMMPRLRHFLKQRRSSHENRDRSRSRGT